MEVEVLETRIGDVRLRTPLIAVSGVFGVNYERISPGLPYVGAIVTKSVTLHPRSGNPEPRIVETPCGLLNSIGLQNPGIDVFLTQEIPRLRVLEIPIIASVAGDTISEYVACSELLATRDEIDAIELNVSCPNVQKGGAEFGADPIILRKLVAEVRRVVGEKTLIAKLSPNITDIAVPVQASVQGGVDAISLINTLRGMAIDLTTQKPILGGKTGGVSGTIIHPVAVYMVYRTYVTLRQLKNNVPIIGMGGVRNSNQAIELILAGASCVGIGTAIFRDIEVFKSVSEGLEQYLKEKREKSITQLVGNAVRR
jgi:dihydroorotate dehydrogenase (NAD+) catalytic subunit